MSTIAADHWPAWSEAEAGRRGRGAASVWRSEVAKLGAQARVRAVLLVCLITPFLVDGVFTIQNAVPEDTLFGQFVHTSGSAVPLVILGFAGQWVLPLLTAVVAGDIFSSEDHFGTWKAVLTRSCSRADIFVGKVAAAMTYSLAMLVVLVAASMAAGVAMGTQPLIGLSGQVVGFGHAQLLVLASWATQVPPLLGFCALALLLSVWSRNSVVGMGGPLVVGLVMQLSTLVNMPEAVRAGLLATPFLSWHGFWVAPAYYGPWREGLVTSVAWLVACIDGAWLVFRYRDIRAS